VDLKAWLDTVVPVSGKVADHDLRFPWNIRRGVGLWKMRYLDDGPVAALGKDDAPADARPDAMLERGRYLVEAVGHCGECHTPRDVFGGWTQRAGWPARPASSRARTGEADGEAGCQHPAQGRPGRVVSGYRPS
jgi:mono/diheme cytochrome c family protein